MMANRGSEVAKTSFHKVGRAKITNKDYRSSQDYYRLLFVGFRILQYYIYTYIYIDAMYILIHLCIILFYIIYIIYRHGRLVFLFR